MSDKDTKITLIGSSLAKEGLEFIFEGESQECARCKLKNTCMKLEKGRRYRIVAVRGDTVHECFIHEGGVKAVDVVKAPIKATVGSRKAVEGSKVVYEIPKCKELDCDLYELCHPRGLRSGDKCTIIEINGSVDDECCLGYSMKKVELGL